MTKRYTENAEAYQYYLKGRYYCNKRPKRRSGKASSTFSRRSKRIRSYALAYAVIAESPLHLQGSMSTRVFPPKEAYPRAKAAAVRALEIDDTLAEPRASLACVNSVLLIGIGRALKENSNAPLNSTPAIPTAHHWYGFYLAIYVAISVRPAQSSSAVGSVSPSH